jgi:5-methylcytosine-specific restriction endonuclease McrBC GTP-binding regulatory subunit McrB
MQLHPSEKELSDNEVLEIVKKEVIGLDINQNHDVVKNNNLENKPLTDWTENQINDYKSLALKYFLELNIGDYVFVRNGEQFIALVKVIGDCEFKQSPPAPIWFRHMRKIEIIETFKNPKYKNKKIKSTRGTLNILKEENKSITYIELSKLLGEILMEKRIKEIETLLKGNKLKQVIFQGPPGTGKTFFAKLVAKYLVNGNLDTENDDISNIDCIKLIQFHPSYSYEDFVRGIIIADIHQNKINYKVEDKVLLQIAKKAETDKNKKCVLIIDEINRANLPSVLGELIYALEYRDNSVQCMYKDQSGKNDIKLPSNLYIIATMNTADRSVGNIDYAIRRRFIFIDFLPDKNIIRRYNANQGIKCFEKVEEIFDNFLSPEYKKEMVMIGHSYFLEGDINKLKQNIKYQVIPLLKEYLADGILKDEASKKIEELANCT